MFLFQRLGDQRIRTQFLRRVMVSVKQRHQLLLYRTGKHFDGHNLTYLCRQAIRLDPDGFSEYLDESAALNDLYIETRYPTDLPFEINEVEIRRYLDMAERMFAAIRRQLYAAGRPHPIEGEEP